MKRLLTTAFLIGMSSIALASTSETWITPTGTSYSSATTTCKQSSENRTQCDVKNPTWTIKPVSHHFVLTKKNVHIEAMMFKNSQFDSVSDALTKNWGAGKDDITKTSLSWKVKDWLYTLSKNPNGEVALIGVKN